MNQLPRPASQFFLVTAGYPAADWALGAVRQSAALTMRLPGAAAASAPPVAAALRLLSALNGGENPPAPVDVRSAYYFREGGPEEPALGQPVNLGVKIEALENVPHGRGERLHVRPEVFPNVVLVPHELFQVQRRGIEKNGPICAGGMAQGSAWPSGGRPAQRARPVLWAPAHNPAGAGR